MFEDLGPDCLIQIFLFVDNKSILNICLTNKYFRHIIEDTAFWKLRLKQEGSWKQLCKIHTNKENLLNSKDLNVFSTVSLQQHILNSETLKFLNNMIKTVAGMGYWGIYLHSTNKKFGKWEYTKNNSLRHFDFLERQLFKQIF